MELLTAEQVLDELHLYCEMQGTPAVAIAIMAQYLQYAIINDAALNTLQLERTVMYRRKDEARVPLSLVPIMPPWTVKQIVALEAYQLDTRNRPYHCGLAHDGDRLLIPTTAGWICPSCTYRQTWAWQPDT